MEKLDFCGIGGLPCHLIQILYDFDYVGMRNRAIIDVEVGYMSDIGAEVGEKVRYHRYLFIFCYRRQHLLSLDVIGVIVHTCC